MKDKQRAPDRPAAIRSIAKRFRCKSTLRYSVEPRIVGEQKELSSVYKSRKIHVSHRSSVRIHLHHGVSGFGARRAEIDTSIAACGCDGIGVVRKPIAGRCR